MTAAGWWRRGQVVQWREMLNGSPWFVTAPVVVEDRPEQLAVYLAEGAPFVYPPGDFPEHPWARRGKTRWEGHGTLILYRPGDGYSVWAFWHGEERRFWGWYVNFEEPWRRSAIGFDKLDLELDILIPEGEPWRWKDRDAFEEQVRDGLISAEQAASVRTDAATVAALLDRAERWWDERWKDWQPDPTWLSPELPDGWDAA